MRRSQVKSPIVGIAVTSGSMRLIADQAFSIFKMELFNMLSMTWKKYQIFKSIIVTDVVEVMNFLFRLKESSDMLLHNTPMFSNIPVRIGIGMVGYLDKFIPVTVKRSSFPARMSFHRIKLIKTTAASSATSFSPKRFAPILSLFTTIFTNNSECSHNLDYTTKLDIGVIA